MHMPASSKLMLIAFGLSPVTLRSLSNIPSVKGQHPEIAILSSKMIPARPTINSSGAKQVPVVKSVYQVVQLPG